MSASQFNGEVKSGIAAAALTGNRFGNLDGSTQAERLINVCGAGEYAAGIIVDDAASGAEAAIAKSGTGYLYCDAAAAIVVGNKLKSNGSGHGILAATDKDNYGAVAEEPLAAGTGIIRVQIERGELSRA